MVSLLLERASTLPEGEKSEPYLYEARETLELIKVYELRDYFKDDCVDAARVVERKLDTVADKSVIIYPVMFRDRLELLVSFSGRLKRFTQPVTADIMTEEVNQLRRKMEKRTTREFLPHAQKVYDWVIRPLEKDLGAVKPDTIVVVPDGPLRTIPPAALHDGRQFLVERFAVAIAPSLNLADPRPVRQERARVLALGISEPVQGFPSLPYVPDELGAIRGLYDGNFLLNRDFTSTSLEQELKRAPYSIVHIASHGHFGSDGGDTFVLTFDDRLTMSRLGQDIGLFRFREDPLDLLTLSACETAAGDNRAALGLAGIAVRAGARCAVATLWHVNDPASFELIAEFYRQLRNPASTRAAALRAAQLRILGNPRYDHPGYWAPFLMINNWL
jgi:CHAT domain-containing protein